jgi:hypothetical protein
MTALQSQHLQQLKDRRHGLAYNWVDPARPISPGLMMVTDAELHA